MKGPPIDQVVYEHMFPRPKSTDPPNFQGLLQRQLVPEVRLETQAFYGHLTDQEAKYPGLDYSHKPHRVRLARYPWHRRLFRAFDNLGLTRSEIAGLTKWEGTRWAKERYEREQGEAILDTTGLEIKDWVEPELRVQTTQSQRADVEDMEDVQDEREEDEMNEELDSDTEYQSVGVELNERLRAAAASREAGNTSTVMDEAWEEWYKDHQDEVESGLLSSDLGLSPNAHIPGTRPYPDSSARLMNAARLGQWQQIPDVLHSLVRQNMGRREGSPTSSLPATQRGSPSPMLNRLSLSPNARRLPSASGPIYDRPPRVSVPTHPGQFSGLAEQYPRLHSMATVGFSMQQPITTSASRSTLNYPISRSREQDSNA